MAAMKNPAQRAGAGRAQEYFAVAANGPEHKPAHIDIQLLRAAWLARRISLPSQTARAVLSIYFGERAQ
jgi:hypothetical protein